ncbi:MAG TPA: hypothetical protein VFW47_00250 [Phenylobacterium sp.]|nr:hypothetical protein [Phenylobacterium sp.]
MLDRRGSPREQVFLTGLLVFGEGRTAPCIIVDRSETGFRIKLLEDVELPDRFGLIDLVAGVGHQGLAVWRNAPLAGARKLESFDLREPQVGPGLILQAAWRAALA